MSEPVPVQLIVAAFQSEEGAKDAWRQLNTAKWGGVIAVDRLAIVRRSEKDKVKIREAGDPGGGQGAVVGTILGGLIGAIAGPLGAVVVGGAAGALVGGLTTKYYDSGIPNARLEKIAAALTPGTSAIVAVIEHKWVRELERDLQETGADVLSETLSVDVARQLAEGKEVTFTTISGDEGVVVARVTGNDKEMESEMMKMTDETGIAVFDLVTDSETAVTAAAVMGDGDGDEDEGGGGGTEGAGVITGDDTNGAGVITGDDTEGAGVITGDEGEGDTTEGAGVITGDDD